MLGIYFPTKTYEHLILWVYISCMQGWTHTRIPQKLVDVGLT